MLVSGQRQDPDTTCWEWFDVVCQVETFFDGQGILDVFFFIFIVFTFSNQIELLNFKKTIIII